MRRMRQILLTLRAVFRQRQVERELDAELSAHLEAETEDLIARGMSAVDARRRAAASMGRMGLIREECRDSRGTAIWENLKKDVTFGLRLLARNRTFSAMAIVTMALAIGSATAVFSVVDGLLLRQLPFAEPERLYHADDVAVRGHVDFLRANSRLADYAANSGVGAFNTRSRDWPERVNGVQVTANFFRVLGVAPLLGQAFAEGDDRPGRPHKVVLSYSYWQQQYGGRRDIIGRQLTLNDVPFTIAGVMPREFRYPSEDASLWTSMIFDPRSSGDYWGINACSTFARLHRGATPKAALAELRTLTPRVRAMFPWRMPDSWASDVRLDAMRDNLVGGVRARSLLLLGVVALVWLIAIVNVANLMIGQTAARRAEFAMRVSLGASPGRLARQLLTEALLLAAMGGIAGTLLAFGQLDLLKRWLPANTPRLGEISIDHTVLGFAVAISLGSGLLFGLLPMWRARSQSPMTPANGLRSTLSRIGMRTDGALVTAEAAFATVLLVGAGLLLHSFWTVLKLTPGYRVDSVITAQINPGPPITGSMNQTLALYDGLRGKLKAYPGVANVAAMSRLPLSREIAALTYAIEDHPRAPDEPAFVLWTTAVTPEHLETLGIPVLRGRSFTDADRQGSAPVVLISRATAHRFWPGVDPVGRRIRPLWETEWQTIIGVVGDVRSYSITGPPDWVDGEIYVPLAQNPGVPQNLALVARLTAGGPAFEQNLPRLVHEVCANCAVSKIAAMEAVVSDAVEAPRSLAWLVGGFALIALTLAAAGVYGVVSHGVLRRAREFGVRLALGARPRSVAWLVVSSSLRQLALGTAIGLAASWALSHWMESLLYSVAGHDPVSFSLPPVVLVFTGLLASLLPMLRAARIDPAKSLREG